MVSVFRKAVFLLSGKLMKLSGNSGNFPESFYEANVGKMAYFQRKQYFDSNNIICLVMYCLININRYGINIEYKSIN
jgi:hypothetical protein